MNTVLTSPQGIDYAIQKAQVIIYQELVSEWGDIITGFGRVYKNTKEGRVIPEMFTSGKDYSGNVIDRDTRFFFSKSSSSEHIGSGYDFKSSVNVYFIVDLSKAKPTATYRADQEVHRDVLRALEVTGFHVKNLIDTGAEDVFSEFKGVFEANKFDDMQPFHVFRCECDLIYDLT